MRSKFLKGKSVAVLMSAFVFVMGLMPERGLANRCAGSVSVSPTATQNICLGSSSNTLTATIIVTGSGSAGNITYQWYSNTVNSTIGGTLVQTLSTTTGTTTNTYTPPTTAAGTLWYYCVVTNTGPTCATSFTSTTVQVTVNALPTVASITGTTSVCVGSTTTLSDATSGGTWSSSNTAIATVGSSTGVVTGVTSGTVTITYTTAADANGCKNSTTASVTVNPLPTITLSATATAKCSSAVAQTTSITYSATTNSPTTYSIVWGASALAAGFVNVTDAALGASPLTLSIPAGAAAATYTGTLTVKNANGCVSSGNGFSLTINALPTMTSSNSATICSGGTVSIALTASPASSFTWIAADNANTTGESTTAQSSSTLSNTITNNTSSVQTVTYTVTPTSTTGSCVGPSQTVTITVNPKPSISAKTATICSETAFSVTPVDGAGGDKVPSGTTYTWANPVSNPAGAITGGSAQGTGQSSISQTLTNTTNTSATLTYTVTPTSGTCVGSTFTVTVTVSPKPSITNQTTSTCSGTAFTVTPANGGGNIVPAGTTYTWGIPVVTGGLTGGAAGSGASITGTLNNPTNAAQTATYTVTPSTATCTGATFTVTVTVNPKPFVDPQTATTCSGIAFTVTPVDGVGNNIVPAGTTYSWAAPVVTGGMTGGAAGSGASITGTLTNPTNISQTATYTVTPNSGCAGSSFTVTVTVDPTPSVTNQTASTCDDIAYSFTPSNGGGNIVPVGTTYTWGAPVVTGGMTGGAAGSGASITGTLDNPTTLTQTATYTVTPVSGSCTGASFTLTVSIYAPPIITADPVNDTVCATYPASFSVTATGSGLTYQWYKVGFGALSDNVFISGSQTATLTIDPTDLPDIGDYYVVVSGLAPCASATSSSAHLQVDQKIVINTQPSTPQTVCEGQSVTYTVVATGGSLSYQWRNDLTYLTDGVQGDGSIISGATTASLTISNITTAEASTKYSVIIADAAAGGSCDTAFSNKATLIVNKKSLDPTSATAASTTICNGQSTTLTLVGGGGGTGEVIKWYTTSCGGTLVGTGNGASVSPTVTTIYYGRYEDPAPCSYNSACAQVTVTVNQKSADPTSASASPSTICNGQSTTLTLTGGGGGDAETIRWYSTACGTGLVGSGNNLSVSPTVTTTYYGRYEDAAPCSYNSACVSVTVTVNQKSTNPTTITASSTICVGSSATLSLSGGTMGTGAIIAWYTGSCGGTLVGTGNNLLVTPATTTIYFGRYEDPAPCSFATSCLQTTITVSQNPTTSNAGADFSVCGLSTTLAANTPTTGTGAWSVVSVVGGSGGTVTTPSSPTSTFSITGFTPAATSGQAICTLVWTISNNPCNPSRDTVIVTFKKTPTANAGLDKNSSCSLSVTLGATAVLTGQTGTWSIISGSGGTVTTPTSNNSTFTSTAINVTTYTLVWTVSSPPCTAATDTMIVTITPPLTNDSIYLASMCRDPSTGAVQILVANRNVLAGGSGTYTYRWEQSCNGSSSFTDIPGQTGQNLILTQGGINCFYRRHVTSSPCSESTSSVFNGNGDKLHININNSLSSVPYAITPSPTASYCNGGLGVQVKTTGSLADDPTNSFTPYTVFYKLYRDGVLVSTKEGTGSPIDFGYQTVAGTYTVTETIQLLVTGALSCGATNLTGSLTITIDANVQPDPVSAGPNQTVCDSTFMNAQAATVGTAGWSIFSGSATIADTSSNTTKVTNLSTGANVFKWRIINGACRDSNFVTITAYQSNKAGTAAANPGTFCNGGGGSDLTQSGGSLGTGAVWKWYTDPAYTVASFAGNGAGANALLHVNPSVTTTYYLRAEGATAPCATNTAIANVTITVNQRPTATWSGTQTMCNGSATLTISFTGSAPWTFTYSTNNCATSTLVTTSTNPYTFNVTPAVTTTYKICSLSDLNCTSLPADYNGTSATVTVLGGAIGTWTGAVSNDWFDCRNWGQGYLPTLLIPVTIPAATPQCQINAAGAVCASLTVSGSSLSFINGAAYLTDAGNVTISGTGSITMAGGGSLEVQGSWSNQVGAAAFTSPVGKVIFSGATSPATITTTAGTETFYNLQLNKTNTTDRVHLNKSLTVSRDLTLTKGIFVTETNLFTWNNSGGILTAPEPTYTANSLNYTQSFIATCDATGTPINVAGPYNPFTGGAGFQIKNVGNADTYFPVGASYQPAGTSITTPAPNRMMIRNQSGTPQDFTVVVNYGDIGYTNGLGGAWRVNRIWYLKSSPGATGFATMQLFFTKRDESLWPTGENEVENGFDYTQPALIQKDYDTVGSRSSFLNLSDPPDRPTFATNLLNTEIYGVYTIGLSTSLTNGIQQFNRFSVVNPGDIVLPVTITNIKAWQEGPVIKIGWTSQQEINIDHYEVEKALDAQHFTYLGSVVAKNTGLSSDYLLTDNYPATGNNYYRIKVVDKNGSVSYTSIVVVNIGKGITRIFIYPNPALKHIFNLEMDNVSAGKYKLMVYDGRGRVVISRDVEHFGGSSTQQIILPAGVAAGAYRVVLLSNDKSVFSTTLIVAD